VLGNYDACFLNSCYSEFPKAARSFLDLYRSFVIELDMDVVIEAFLEIWV